MRPGEEHQAAKEALRRGNARRRSYDLLADLIRLLWSFLLLPVCFSMEYRNG